MGNEIRVQGYVGRNLSLKGFILEELLFRFIFISKPSREKWFSVLTVNHRSAFSVVEHFFAYEKVFPMVINGP